jgi:hypothetical protein
VAAADHDGHERADERVDVQVAAEREGGDDRHAEVSPASGRWSNSTQRSGVVQVDDGIDPPSDCIDAKPRRAAA